MFTIQQLFVLSFIKKIFYVLRVNCLILIFQIPGVQETVKIVEGVGGKAYGYKCNLADRQEVYQLAEKTLQEVGEVS